MQTTVKKPSESKTKREKVTKDDATRTHSEDKLKKTPYTVSTPRGLIQKSTTADIYGLKKKTAVQSAKAPKKSPGSSNTASNVSPMKDLLKSSPSSISQLSTRSERTKMATTKMFDAKTTRYSATPRSQDFSVAINSPIVKRKLNMDFKREDSFAKDVSKDRREREKSFVKDATKDPKEREKSFVKDATKDRKKREKSFVKDATKDRKEREKSFVQEKPKDRKEKEKSFVRDATKERREKSFIKEVGKDKKEQNKVGSKGSERHRTKTRTLDESEVKVLNSEVVDNNAEMLNLSRKLSAQPKAFYVELDNEKPSHSKMVSIARYLSK